MSNSTTTNPNSSVKPPPSPYPLFSSLPLKPDGPRGNAWGLFGASDELGMLNHLTPSTTITASKEIQLGIRISTDWNLDKPLTPCFGRQKFEQRIVHKKPRTVNDDVLVLNTQSSSQWDGFRHFGYQDHKLYFNGCTQDEIHNSTRNGIHAWVESGGIVGRGVLIDYYTWALSQNRTVEPLTTQIITVSDLEAVAAAQGVSFLPGDILFVRSGFIKAISEKSEGEVEEYAKVNPPPAIGLRASPTELEWLWTHRFSAVAGDMPAFEALPFQSTEFWMHEWLLAGWGLPIGELFDLERLAEICKREGRYSFWFGSMPLKVPGGIASPPNGVAIL